jgi:Excreted virulence factor EspC, type VII ESX diderm
MARSLRFLPVWTVDSTSTMQIDAGSSHGGDRVKVDPEALRAIAGTVDEAAGTFQRGYALRSARLGPVDGQAGGWSAAGAARSAKAAWDGLVRRLGAAGTYFGSDLSTAAADYEATDREAARVIAATTAPGARVVGS